MTLSRRAAWTLSSIATLTMAVSYVDRQTLAALAPSVTHDLRIGETAYGWLQSAFSFAYLVGAPIAGRWVDRVGARRGLFLAVVAWSAIAALQSVALGLGTLVVLRVALGLAEAPSFPGAAQTVQRALPPADRPAGFGVLFSGSSIGAAIAPVIAVGLYARFGWRGAFAGTALAGLAWIPLWLAATRSRAARDVLGPAETTPAQTWRPLLELCGNRDVLRAVVVVLATAPLMAFLLLWTSKYLVATFHLVQADVGRYLWLPPLCFDVGGIALGGLASLAERARAGAAPRGFRHRRLFAFASVAMLASAAVPAARGPWTAMALMGVAMLGGGGAWSVMTSDMMARVEPARVSSAGGITAAAQSLAYIVANPLMGAVVEHQHRYDVVLYGLAIWTLPGAAAWLTWPPRAAREA